MDNTVDFTEFKYSKLLDEAITNEGFISQAYNTFWNYSFGNQLMVTYQCFGRDIPLGPVSTYKKWKELGRTVKKGEKALTMLMPISIKDKGDPDKKFTLFKPVKRWFVISQTEVAEGEIDGYVMPEVPRWDKETALEALDVAEIRFDRVEGNIMGFARSRNVAINPINPAPFKTLIHEIAHVLLKHTTEGSSESILSTDVKEVEAEGVAYLVNSCLGMKENLSSSRAYIQGWLRTDSIPEKSVRRIFTTTSKILKAGLPSATD